MRPAVIFKIYSACISMVSLVSIGIFFEFFG